MESDAANWIRENGTKPVVGFIAGQTAPKGRRMGHAGAIIGGKDDTAEAKMKIMEECGIAVVVSPAEIGQKMAELVRFTVSIEEPLFKKLEDLVVKLQPVNYADVKEMAKMVKRLLSSRILL